MLTCLIILGMSIHKNSSQNLSANWTIVSRLAHWKYTALIWRFFSEVATYSNFLVVLWCYYTLGPIAQQPRNRYRYVLEKMSSSMYAIK